MFAITNHSQLLRLTVSGYQLEGISLYGEQLTDVTFSRLAQRDLEWALEGVENILRFTASDFKLTDKAVAQLPVFSSLEYLDLSKSSVVNPEINEKRFPNLQVLKLSGMIPSHYI